LSLSASQPISSSTGSKTIQAGPQSSASSVESSLTGLSDKPEYPPPTSVTPESWKDGCSRNDGCCNNSKHDENNVQGNYNKNNVTCTRLRKGRITEE
jgi:hypothetical protein